MDHCDLLVLKKDSCCDLLVVREGFVTKSFSFKGKVSEPVFIMMSAYSCKQVVLVLRERSKP